MSELIECKKNGFIYEGIFYAYQTIQSIHEIRTFDDDDTYRVLCGCCTEENAASYHQIYFKVSLEDDKRIYIGYKYSTNLYEFIPRKNKLLSRWFGKKRILNRKLEEFWKQNLENHDDFEKLKEQRNELIAKFNEWNA